MNYSDEERAKIAKHASEMGVTNAMRFFRKEFHDRPLQKSIVRSWKNKYEQQLKYRQRCDKSTKIENLECARRKGHPLLLGSKMDSEV